MVAKKPAMVAKKPSLVKKSMDTMTMEEKKERLRSLRLSVHKDTVLEDAWNSEHHAAYIEMFRQNITTMDLVMVTIPFWATGTSIPSIACRLVRKVNQGDDSMGAGVTRIFYLEDIEV